jgi:glycerate kinase
MRYLIAPDKFKGTLNAQEVAETIASAIRDRDPKADVDLLPVADGGEGTATLLATQLSAERKIIGTVDPIGRPIDAEYFVSGGEAILDMSAASGLWRVRPDERDPLQSSTYGTGIIIWHLIENGIERIFIGLGGSATVDAGLGMGAALGYRFYGSGDSEVEPLPAAFGRIRKVKPPPMIRTPEVIGLADVETTLTGPQGAIYTFGPQKGLSGEQVQKLDRELAGLVLRLEQSLGTNFSSVARAGAAGGFGYGILTFLKGKLVSGFEVIADKLELRKRIQAADIVITGEGKLDLQSLEGKAPYGVAVLAKEAGKRVWAIAGVIENRDLVAPHFEKLISLAGEGVTLEKAMGNPVEVLRRRTIQLCGAALSAQRRPKTTNKRE